MSERTEEEREQLELSRQLGRFKPFVAVKGQEPVTVSSIALTGDRMEIFSRELDEMIEQLAQEEPEEVDKLREEHKRLRTENGRLRENLESLTDAVKQFLSHQGQDLCHDRREELAEAAGVYLPEPQLDDYESFCDGCDAYQRQLYGKCRTEDVLHDLGRELWEAEKALGEILHGYTQSGLPNWDAPLSQLVSHAKVELSHLRWAKGALLRAAQRNDPRHTLADRLDALASAAVHVGWVALAEELEEMAKEAAKMEEEAGQRSDENAEMLAAVVEQANSLAHGQAKLERLAESLCDHGHTVVGKAVRQATEELLHDLGRELWEAEKVLGEAMGWRGSLKELAKEVAARCEDYEFLLGKLSEAEEKLVSASPVEQIEAVARALGEDGELLRIALRGLRKEAGQVSEEQEEQEEPASQLSVDQRLDQISDRLQDIGNELSDLRLMGLGQGRGREGISWARRLVEMAEQMAYAEAGQIRKGQGRSA